MQTKMNWNSPYVRKHRHEKSESYGDGIYCVYLWQENETGKVFYVGSGKYYRFNDVHPKSRSKEFIEHINIGKCSPRILAYGIETKEAACTLERKLIDTYWRSGFPLVNKNGIIEREREYRQRGYRNFKAKQHRRVAEYEATLVNTNKNA